MKRIHLLVLNLLLAPLASLPAADSDSAQPFGTDSPKLDSLATGEWWTKSAAAPARPNAQPPPPPMDVPRDQVVAFALYTVHGGVMKLTAQLYPLKPGEPRPARLEVKRDGAWVEIAKSEVLYPGWDVHFRVDKWDATKGVAYRVRHGETAMFDGLIRRDPVDRTEIVVASMSCNSSRTPGLRPEIIDNLKAQNTDLLFFAGDQTYRHTEHTAGWIELGLQFRDVMRDRPTISIPDDHGVGHGNLWGENGKRSTTPGDDDGGYANPPDITDEKQRADGYGIARFHKAKRIITFECWPRFPDVTQGDKAQFPGWPITVAMDANDGRKVAGWLPELVFEGIENPVVQVIEEATGEILCTIRAQGTRFQPRVYAAGKYTVKVGREKPDARTLTDLEAGEKAVAGLRTVKL